MILQVSLENRGFLRISPRIKESTWNSWRSPWKGIKFLEIEGIQDWKRQILKLIVLNSHQNPQGVVIFIQFIHFGAFISNHLFDLHQSGLQKAIIVMPSRSLHCAQDLPSQVDDLSRVRGCTLVFNHYNIQSASFDEFSKPVATITRGFAHWESQKTGHKITS